MEYKELYSVQSHGGLGSFGLKIEVACSVMPDLKLDPIRNAAYDAAEKIEAEVRAASLALDPTTELQSRVNRAEIIGLFDSPIFVEEIPNGYWNKAWHSRHLPWFIVTTTVGRFKIGWRKRVIEIEWSETCGTKTAEELFPTEKVTKDRHLIHAWSLEDARRYVATVVSSAPVSNNLILPQTGRE